MNGKTVRSLQTGSRVLCGVGGLILLGSVGACECGSIGIEQFLIQAVTGFAMCVVGAWFGGLMRSGWEQRVRDEVTCILGRDLSDSTWAEMYAKAQKKLRYIISRYGDADGTRCTVDYLTQLTLEAIQDQAFSVTLYRADDFFKWRTI